MPKNPTIPRSPSVFWAVVLGIFMLALVTYSVSAIGIKFGAREGNSIVYYGIVMPPVAVVFGMFFFVMAMLAFQWQSGRHWGVVSMIMWGCVFIVEILSGAFQILEISSCQGSTVCDATVTCGNPTGVPPYVYNKRFLTQFIMLFVLTAFTLLCLGGGWFIMEGAKEFYATYAEPEPEPEQEIGSRHFDGDLGSHRRSDNKFRGSHGYEYTSDGRKFV